MEHTIVNMRKHDHLKHSKLSEIRIHEGPGLNWFFNIFWSCDNNYHLENKKHKRLRIPVGTGIRCLMIYWMQWSKLC